MPFDETSHVARINTETNNIPVVLIDPYKLRDLPDPPEDWCFLGRAYRQLKSDRSTKLSVCDALARIHLWGYEYHSKGRPKRSELLRAMWKVFYNQREECRPSTWPDLFLTSRDSGPRLLPYNIQPAPVPVSRFYPHEPSPLFKPPPTYIRPFDAPEGVPDWVISQFLLPLDDPSKAASSSKEAPSSSTALPFPGEGSIIDTLPTVGSPLRESSQGSPSSSPWDTSSGVLPINYSHGYEAMPVIQAIQRAVFKFTYADLERCHTAPRHEPSANRVAMSDEDLRLVHVGSHPAHLYLSLGTDLDWSTSGNKVLVNYRGRGPVWDNESCSLDSVIVLGKLLQAGSTVIDRKGNRPQKWSPETKAFVEATNVNWEVLPREVSIRIRHRFWQMLEIPYPFIRTGITWMTFSTVTKEIAQFQYHGRDFSTACACQGSHVDSEPYSGNCISVRATDADYLGVDVSTLVGRVWFGRQVYQCRLCGAQNGLIEERRIDQLPLRLVMNTMIGEQRIKVNDHTADFTIDYPDGDGNMQKARYRWIGGIYHYNGHARVYFRDSARGEVDSRELSVYDGALSSGVIMGGLPEYSATELIDPRWTEGGMVIVIYELVLNPSMDDLTAATAGINAMVKLARNNQPVLPGLNPWERISSPIVIPEKRTIPVAANRFYDVDRAELPAPFNAASNEMTARGLAMEYGCDGLGIGRATNSSPSSLSSIIPQGGPNAQDFIDAMPGLASIWKSPTPGPMADIPQESQWTVPDMTVEELMTEYPQFFSSDGITDPSFLADHQELWPNGPPSPGGGSTNWPVLPRVSPSVTPEKKSPMSVTEEFLDLSAYDDSNANADGRKTTRRSSILGMSGDGTFQPLTGNLDWDLEMEDVQFDPDTILQFASVDQHREVTKRSKSAACQRARPSPRQGRPVRITAVKEAKDSLRKRALWNSAAAKKKVGPEKRPRKAKVKEEPTSRK